MPAKLIVAAGIFALCATGVRAGEAYKTQGDCGGFPRVNLQTAPGTCVGLVAPKLGFARAVAAIGQDVYVVDMGGWHKGRGRVLRLSDGGRGAPVALLTGLDEPNGLAVGPNGTLYVGLLGKIIRFDPGAPNPATTVRDAVTGLPVDGRHPLSALAVAADGSLFVNVGSKTDHCEKPNDDAPDPAKPCPETTGDAPRAAILHVVPKDTAVDVHGLEPYARGLRNSMALAILPSGDLVAGVNARDYIDHADSALSDEDLPHDTFDRVVKGADYGWPYCYDKNLSSPEYPHFDCAAKTAPTFLLPPHAASLGMLLYRGTALPGLDGKLVLGLHGYRAAGHRIVTLAIDAHGQPNGDLQDLVSGWDAVKSDHPQGAPVGIYQAGDGSILIVEDHNGTLLRLTKSGP
jgi:glucose/arabinose dehydrogenase